MSAPVKQVRPFTVTVPAGTAQATPQVTPLPLEDYWRIVWVEMEVPPGPRGTMGFYVAASKTPILPFAPAVNPQFFTMDNRMPRYDLDPDTEIQDLSLVAYNVDNYPHTVYLRFGLTIAPAPVSVGPVLDLLPRSALSGVASPS